MTRKEIEDRLQELKIEDFIWIIYIGIIALSLYSNSLERKYFINNDIISRNKYRNIIILIFSILVIVYFYFLKSAYNDLKDIKSTDSKKYKLLNFASYIASLLIAISGIIFLIIAIADEDINIELAFS